MAEEENTQQNTSTTSNPSNSTTSEQEEEDKKKQEEEKKKSENEEKEEEFHPHKGKIMQIKPYTQISSYSFDKAYDNPTGTSKVEIHYTRDELQEHLKYIYKGVSCKSKILRSSDKEGFTSTGIQEIGLNEDEIKAREHYPTQEMLDEISSQEALNDLLNEEEGTVTDEDVKEYSPITRSDGDGGCYGFITDVEHDSEGTELEIKDYGYCLEDNTKELSFNHMRRSEILVEVIRSYGLEAFVDFTGLRDDYINWTNRTQTESKDNDDNTTNLKKSDEWDDSTTSHDLCGYDTRTVDYAGKLPPNPDDPKYYETIHDPNANYTKFVSGCTSPEQVMKKLRPLAKYSSYPDNRDANAKVSFEKLSSPGLNCGDSARLVKCCMDACDIPCIVIHVKHCETAPYGHYYNAVRKGNTWLTTDLCRVNETIKNRTMTQQLGV